MTTETGPSVLIIPGACYVLFDLPASSGTADMLRQAGFTSRFGTIWTGTKDDLLRTELPAYCYPPGHPAKWPSDWSSLDSESSPTRSLPPGLFR